MINWLNKKNISKKILMLSLANIISFNAFSQEPNQISSNKNFNDAPIETIINQTQSELLADNTITSTKKETKKQKTKQEELKQEKEQKITTYSKQLLNKKIIEPGRHIITNSQIDWSKSVINKEGCKYPNAEFDLYMKRAKQKDNSGPKLSYWRTGIFKLDSLSGLKTGYDFDLMAEHFDKSKGNTFRHWNRFRMGMYAIAESNTYHPTKIENVFDLIDGELTIKYLHIPQKLRGDQTLSKRKGYVEASFGIRTNFDKNINVGIKPFGATWMRATYEDKHYNRSTIHKSAGVDVEILTNKNGYKKGLTKYTKDYYKGISFMVGAKYDFVTKSPYLNVGVRLVTRNH